MDTPKIAFHGGKCCGIKVIHSLGCNPAAPADGLVRKPRTHNSSNADQIGGDVSSATNFYNQDCLAETYLERIDRYIAYLDVVRPNGIIEVTLAETTDKWYNQVSVWGPLLEERGFVVVNDCHNSNSGNRVFVYHRKTDKPVTVPAQPETYSLVCEDDDPDTEIDDLSW